MLIDDSERERNKKIIDNKYMEHEHDVLWLLFIYFILYIDTTTLYSRLVNTVY